MGELRYKIRDEDGIICCIDTDRIIEIILDKRNCNKVDVDKIKYLHYGETRTGICININDKPCNISDAITTM